MEFKIKPFEVKAIATTLLVRVTDILEQTIQIYYELRRADGVLAESGNKIFPRDSLMILAQNPMPKEHLNMLLSQFGIELAEDPVPEEPTPEEPIPEEPPIEEETPPEEEQPEGEPEQNNP